MNHPEAPVRRPQNKAQRRRRPTPDVPNTPEARAHAEEAKEVEELLKTEFGVEAEMVRPTRDGRGHVRLNFDQLYSLIYEPEDD